MTDNVRSFGLGCLLCQLPVPAQTVFQMMVLFCELLTGEMAVLYYE